MSGLSCYKQDGINKSRTIEECPDDKLGCYLHYKLHRSNYQETRNDIQNVTSIRDPTEIIPISSRCMLTTAYPNCNQTGCSHWYTSHNDTKGNYNMHCCCTSNECNEVTKLNLDFCLQDDCDNDEDNGSTSSCFCPPDISPPTTVAPNSVDHLFVILLCSIVVVIVVALIGAMTYLVFRTRYRNRQQANPPTYPINPINGVDPPDRIQPTFDEQIVPLLPTESSIESYEEKFKDYRYCFNGPNQESLCGEGRYGAVHRVEHRKTGQIYAMKIFRHKGPASDDNLTSIRLMWHKEYEHLKLCHHRNIVKRSGAGRFKYCNVLDYAILLEYCPLGSLSSWLDKVAKDEAEDALTLIYALQIARDIACGLEFLHEAVTNVSTVRVPVAHRDIKSSNILLRSPDHAVISDFGLAITLNNLVDSGYSNINQQPDMDVHRLKRCGTPRYLSPELLEGPMDVHNFADAFRQADVYSMSIVHWELFRMCKELNGNFNGIHELPYQHELGAEKATIDRLQGIVSKGTRPIIPPTFKETVYGATIYKILIESWDHDPSARVTASTVNQRLQGVIDQKDGYQIETVSTSDM